jgi:drug/metabolite transporter (DMT)-like permease
LYIAVILAGFGFIFKDALHSQLKITGVLLGVSAMIIYSVYLIVIQGFLKKENPLSLSFYTIVFAAISFSMVFGFPKGTPNEHQLLIILSLGLITTVISIGFLFAAIELIGSSLTSVFSSFEPVITIVLSVVVLGIGMNTYQIIGAILILIGVFMANIYHLASGEKI